MKNKFLVNKKLMMVLAIAWTILIFIGCSFPGKDLPAISVFDHFDKVVHFTFFFVFAILWLLTCSSQMESKWWIAILMIQLLSFGYGFALEYYQINFVPGRNWDVWDGIADGVGGIAGSLFFYKLAKSN